jgi:hypothetical protein
MDPIAFVPFAATFILFCLLGSWLGGGRLEKILLTPGSVFCFWYGLTYFLIPGIAGVAGNFLWVQEYRPETFWEAYLGFTAFGLCAAGAWWRFSDRLGVGQIREEFRTRTDLPLTSVREILLVLSPFLVLALGASLNLAMNVMRSGGLAGYLATRLITVQDEGPLQMPLQWWMIVPIPLIYNWHTTTSGREKRTSLALALSALGVAVMVGVLQGSRTRTLLPVLLFLLAWGIMAGRKGLSQALKTGMATTVAVMALLGIGLGVSRELAVSGRWDDALRLATTKYTTEAYGEFENALWLIENRPQIDLKGGETFGAALGVVVPRAIWPEKPLGSGPLMRNLVQPYAYERGSASNLSPVTTGLPPEAYMNYGWMGFIAVGLAYGCFLGFCGWLSRFALHPFALGLYLTVTYRGVEFLSMEAAGGLANLIFVSLPFLVLIGLYEGLEKMRPSVP